MWRLRGTFGNCGYTISVAPSGSYLETERVKMFSDCPKNLLVVEDMDRVDFNEAILPEDIWEGDLEDNEF